MRPVGKNRSPIHPHTNEIQFERVAGNVGDPKVEKMLPQLSRNIFDGWMWMSVTLKSVFDVITLKRYLPFRWETSVQWINIPGASDWLTDCRWLFSSKVSCSNYFWKEIDLPHHICLGREKENWCAIVQPRYLLRSQPLPIWLIDLITPLPSALPPVHLNRSIHGCLNELEPYSDRRMSHKCITSL